jgi:hypothetical protein
MAAIFQRPSACGAFLRGTAPRIAALSLVVLISSGLAACPFSYDLPLSAPADAIVDNALVGSWKMQDPESGQLVTIEFLRFNEKEYVAWSREPDGAAEKVVVYRVFVTDIEGERFLNSKELGAKTGRSWSFANYRINGDTLSLRFVDDAIFASQTFDSSDALREFVRRNLHDPRLYATDEGKESVMRWQRVSD